MGVSIGIEMVVLGASVVGKGDVNVVIVGMKIDVDTRDGVAVVVVICEGDDIVVGSGGGTIVCEDNVMNVEVGNVVLCGDDGLSSLMV